MSVDQVLKSFMFQNLSYEILQRLDLSPSLQDLLPLFVHLRTVTLPDYHSIVEKVKEERQPKYPDGDPYYDADLDIAAITERHEEEEDDNGLQKQSEEEVWRSDESRCDYQEKLRKHDQMKQDRKMDGAVKLASNDLVFTAPLPEHFRWTMERLGVPLDTDDTFGYSS